MTRTAPISILFILLLAFLLTLGCDDSSDGDGDADADGDSDVDGDGDGDGDGDCTDDRPIMHCPESLELGCVPADGVTLDLGGMIWKGEKSAQKMVLEKMEPNTADLIRRVQEFLDPNRIMNPGKWEV